MFSITRRNNRNNKKNGEQRIGKKGLREKTILEQFPNNVQCMVLSKINQRMNFGHSNNLRARVEKDKKHFKSSI